MPNFKKLINFSGHKKSEQINWAVGFEKGESKIGLKAWKENVENIIEAKKPILKKKSESLKSVWLKSYK